MSVATNDPRALVFRGVGIVVGLFMWASTGVAMAQAPQSGSPQSGNYDGHGGGTGSSSGQSGYGRSGGHSGGHGSYGNGEGGSSGQSLSGGYAGRGDGHTGHSGAPAGSGGPQGQSSSGGDAGQGGHGGGMGNRPGGYGEHAGWHGAGFDRGNPRWWQGRHEFNGYSGRRPGFFFAPGYGYHPVPSAYYGRAWGVGAVLPIDLRRYIVADPTVYGVEPAPSGYRWIYVDDGLAMIDGERGVIVRSVWHIW